MKVFSIALLLCLSAPALAQDTCEGAQEIPPDFVGNPILGSTSGQNATADGCGQAGAIPTAKQWYSFTLPANDDTYYTFAACAKAAEPAVASAVQSRCGDQACYQGAEGVVDPAELDAGNWCQDHDNRAYFTFLHRNMLDSKLNAFVALGADDSTTGPFTAALIRHSPPANDACAEAIGLEKDAPAATEGSLFNAVPLTDAVCGQMDKVAVWYSFTGHNIYPAVIRTCPAEAGWKHTLAVQASCDDQSCVSGTMEDNPACPDGGKQLTVKTSVRDYRVAVVADSLTAARGDFAIEVLTKKETPAPTALPETSAPTAVPTAVSGTEAPTGAPTSVPAGSTSSASSRTFVWAVSIAAVLFVAAK